MTLKYVQCLECLQPTLVKAEIKPEYFICADCFMQNHYEENKK